MCQVLAKELGQTIAKLFPESKIECFIYSFNPAEGFWSSEILKCTSCDGKINREKSCLIRQHGPASSFVDVSIFPCERCNQLHWESGLPVINKEGKRAFLIGGRIIYK